MPLDGFLELTKGGAPVTGENLDAVFGPKKAMGIASFWMGSEGMMSSSKKKKKHGVHQEKPSTLPGARSTAKAIPKPPSDSETETDTPSDGAKPKQPLKFRVTKEVDLATTQLFLAYCQHADRDKLASEGSNPDCFDSATVTLRKASGGGPLPFLVVTFHEVFVDKFEIKTDKDKLPIESITFSFKSCTFGYATQKQSGTGKPREVTPDFEKAAH